MKDVVILGAGLAGLTAAYYLRDLDVTVLEREDRVGGRTFSGDWQETYWYNAGAQFVWDHRTLDIARQLGVEVLDAGKARTALYLRDRLVDAPNHYLLLLKLPLSIGEKIDFARTILRLRRIASRYPNVDRFDLDARALHDIMGNKHQITRDIIDCVTESGMALSTDEVSGYIGLSYAIHLFGGDANDVLKAVRGGTQQLTLGMARELGERVLTGVEVTSVSFEQDGSVSVRYRSDGKEEAETARVCVVALPSKDVLNTVQGLDGDKRAALSRMSPYGRAMTVACLTSDESAIPWDRFVVMPVLGKCFELVSNNSYFIRRREPDHEPGGALITISTMERANSLWNLPDEEVGRRVVEDLRSVFSIPVGFSPRTVVNRWEAFPPFRPGALTDQAILRRPMGSIFFAGDYTAQPGTPGAVGSGYYASVAVRKHLGEPEAVA